MFRGIGLVRGFAALAVFIFSAGCAVLPIGSTSTLQAPVAQRDILADAAAGVERAPWPKPEPVSLMARITGGGERVTRSSAIAAYLGDLSPKGARFATLKTDARANLLAAEALYVAAGDAMNAPLLSMNDVVLIEAAMRSLREHRDIFVDAAKQIERSGEPVDRDALDELRDSYRLAIRKLGAAADGLAERIERDHSSAYAGPDKAHRRNLSDL